MLLVEVISIFLPSQQLLNFPRVQLEKYVLIKHTFQQDHIRHYFKFDDTVILSTTSNYYPRLYFETIEIHKHAKNFNKEGEGLPINKKLTSTEPKVSGLESSPRPSINTVSFMVVASVVVEPQRRKLRPQLNHISRSPPQLKEQNGWIGKEFQNTMAQNIFLY